MSCGGVEERLQQGNNLFAQNVNDNKICLVFSVAIGSVCNE